MPWPAVHPSWSAAPVAAELVSAAAAGGASATASLECSSLAGKFALRSRPVVFRDSVELTGQATGYRRGPGRKTRDRLCLPQLMQRRQASPGVHRHGIGRPVTLINAPSNPGLRRHRPGHEPGTWRDPEVLTQVGLTDALSPSRITDLEHPAYKSHPEAGSGLLNGVAIRDRLF